MVFQGGHYEEIVIGENAAGNGQVVLLTCVVTNPHLVSSAVYIKSNMVPTP
ncbi:hypothetical protein D3C71_2159130 [compost metagenome]